MSSRVQNILTIHPQNPPKENLGTAKELIDTPVFNPQLQDLLKQPETQSALSNDTWPIPATEDREGYHGDRHLEYWLSGRADYLKAKYFFEAAGRPVQPGFSIFEFGCATGRVLRHFSAQEPKATTYGCDLNANHVQWMKQHLKDDLVAFQNTSYPHLQLEDNCLDAIMAFSVFTHINEFEDAWLLELRRILKPGGVAYLTIHSDRTWNEMKEDYPVYQNLRNMQSAIEDYQISMDLFRAEMPSSRIVFEDVKQRVYNANTFHKKEYILKEWARYFDVIAIEDEAHSYQDGVILKKRG